MIIASYKKEGHLVRLSGSGQRLCPGDLVRHLLWPKSLGIVVCVAPEQFGVLWSRTNEEIRALDNELDKIMRTL